MIQQQMMKFVLPPERQRDVIPEQQTPPKNRWHKTPPGTTEAPPVILQPSQFLRKAMIIPVEE